MTDRIIDISQEGVWLSVSLSRLSIKREGQVLATIPLDEVAVVVVSHPNAAFSHAALSGLAANGAMLVCCDEKHNPCGVLLPLHGHHAQTPRFLDQAEASAPLRKQLWRQIVRAKIRAQHTLLTEFKRDENGLAALEKQVRSGDTGNIEAQAARRYWQALFKGLSFTRDRDGDGPNRLLNYGYAVLRACTARAICASGLHPGLGLHHHNQYSAFPLADDLMEPFRPLIDRVVASLVATHGRDCALLPETKSALVGAVTGRYEIDGENRTLFDILSRLTSSLVRIFRDKQGRLHLPQLTIPASEAQEKDDDIDL